MRSESVNVLADANVLWSPQLRNLLLQLAHQDVFRIFRNDLIIEEWLRNIGPDQRARCEAGTVPLMRRHFPQAWLPATTARPLGTTDRKDRHVAAAAVPMAPSVLVTWNLQGFDREALHVHGVEVLSPDHFLRRTFDGAPAVVLEFTRQAQANLTRTAPTWDAYIALLVRIDLVDFVAGINSYPAHLDTEPFPRIGQGYGKSLIAASSDPCANGRRFSDEALKRNETSDERRARRPAPTHEDGRSDVLQHRLHAGGHRLGRSLGSSINTAAERRGSKIRKYPV